MKLIDIGADVYNFFKILPQDWQDVIVPVWGDYRKNTRIYVFENSGEITAGGIIFSGVPPKMTPFETGKCQKYMNFGYHYIGFLFVAPEYRNQALGSKWISALKEKFPNRSYWLTIEEEGLRSFYEKNGFKCVSESKDSNNREWILTYQPQ